MTIYNYDHFPCSLSPAAALVKKLTAVLESVEKLPVYNYDLPGSGYGLQVCISICIVIYHASYKIS